MPTIQGPQGTGDRFLNFVNKMKAKGKSDLQARRIAAGGGIENAERYNKALRNKKKKKK